MHNIVTSRKRRRQKSRDISCGREAMQESCKSELVRELGHGTCYAIVKACKTAPPTSPTHLRYAQARDLDSLGFARTLIPPSGYICNVLTDLVNESDTDVDETFKHEIVNVQRSVPELRLIHYQSMGFRKKIVKLKICNK